MVTRRCTIAHKRAEKIKKIIYNIPNKAFKKKNKKIINEKQKQTIL